MMKFICLMLFSVQLFAATIELNWTAPTEREDGTAIENIDRFNLYHTANNGSQNIVQIDSTVSSYQVLDAEEGTHTFQIRAVEDGREGALSDVVAASVMPPVEIVISNPSKIGLTVRVID